MLVWMSVARSVPIGARVKARARVLIDVRRAQQKVQTLGKLRDAAREVFAELGVGATSIQDITSRAGVAVGTFYMHFESKDQLVDSLVEEMNQGLAVAMLNALKATPPPKTRALVRELAKVVVGYWSEHERSIPLLTNYHARHADEEMLRLGANKNVVQLVRGLVHAFPKKIELKATPEWLVTALVSMWRATGMHGTTLDAKGRARAVDHLAQGTEMLLDGFVPGLLDVESRFILAAIFAARPEPSPDAAPPKLQVAKP